MLDHVYEDHLSQIVPTPTTMDAFKQKLKSAKEDQSPLEKSEAVFDALEKTTAKSTATSSSIKGRSCEEYRTA